jgi:hypothetical protein
MMSVEDSVEIIVKTKSFSGIGLKGSVGVLFDEEMFLFSSAAELS